MRDESLEGKRREAEETIQSEKQANLPQSSPSQPQPSIKSFGMPSTPHEKKEYAQTVAQSQLSKNKASSRGIVAIIIIGVVINLFGQGLKQAAKIFPDIGTTVTDQESYEVLSALCGAKSDAEKFVAYAIDSSVAGKLQQFVTNPVNEVTCKKQLFTEDGTQLSEKSKKAINSSTGLLSVGNSLVTIKLTKKNGNVMISSFTRVTTIPTISITIPPYKYEPNR
jgi:hypothetical protein